MSNQQVQKVKVKKLAHVGLWATDMQAQARFYHQMLGLDLRTAVGGPSEQEAELEEAAMFLAVNDEYCVGLFNEARSVVSNGRKPSALTSLHHLSFTVDTDAELAALAARLNSLGIELAFEMRDGDPELGDALWFQDPDGNRIEITVASDELRPYPGSTKRRHVPLRPYALQHIALNTMRLEEMVEFYIEALGFDISDWLLRESAWLRCNDNHHTLLLTYGKPGIDHIGFSIADGTELLRWADLLSQRQIPLLWGPGRHGVGDDLFIRFADAEGIHIELSAGLQQYHDHDVTTPPRLWHTRSTALNLWGTLPVWLHEEVQV